MLEELGVAISFGLIPVAIFLLCLYLFHLIRAPVYQKWEKEKQPRLSVHDVYEEDFHDSVGGSVGLRIKNEGAGVLNNCHARLVAIDFETPRFNQTMDRIPTNRDIHCDNIIAGRSTGNVRVVSYFGHMDEQKPQIEYLDHTQNWLPVFWNQPLILLLHIWGDNCKPIYVVCKLAYRPGKDFDFSVLKFAPLENDIKLSDFQTITSGKENSHPGPADFRASLGINADSLTKEGGRPDPPYLSQ